MQQQEIGRLVPGLDFVDFSADFSENFWKYAQLDLGPSVAEAPRPEDLDSSILQPWVPQNPQTLSRLSSSMCLPT